MKLIISFLLTLSFITQLKAQDSACDTVYTFLSLTKQATSDVSFSSITNQWIVPPLTELKNEYQIYITSLRLTFIIDKEGKIVQVEFLRNNIPEPYRQKIIDNLIQNTQWQPAEIDGNPVCSELLFPIQCLLWRD